jgi:hypothetical protein
MDDLLYFLSIFICIIDNFICEFWGWSYELIYADDLLLMSQSEQEFKEKLQKWKL